MTTHELLEMVSLDALGLLDEQEREEFERAFMAAPPAVQAQIRREQARLARGDGLLPAVEPPPGLRARVIAAVREAMQAVTARRGVAGRIGPLLPGRGVTPAWRVAAIGCAAAALVFAVTTVHMRSVFDRVNDQIQQNQREDLFAREFGVRFRQTLFSKDTTFVQFAGDPSGGAAAAEALLMLEADRSSGQLLIRGLPEAAGEYSLRVVDEEGNVVGDAIVTFRAGEPHKRVKGLALRAGQSLAILAPGSKDSALLRSIAPRDPWL